MRAVLLGSLVLSAALAGCVEVPFMGEKPEALVSRAYVREVGVAVSGLTMVFEQADESVKAFQNGWLASEGAASQFGFLRDQVVDIKSDITKSQPPADMQTFHRQLGRSVSFTQQAMDAMQAGFESGDATYFDLAQQKLAEARKTLDKASESI